VTRTWILEGVLGDNRRVWQPASRAACETAYETKLKVGLSHTSNIPEYYRDEHLSIHYPPP
jgi:hypothetical protein